MASCEAIHVTPKDNDRIMPGVQINLNKDRFSVEMIVPKCPLESGKGFLLTLFTHLKVIDDID